MYCQILLPASFCRILVRPCPSLFQQWFLSNATNHKSYQIHIFKMKGFQYLLDSWEELFPNGKLDCPIDLNFHLFFYNSSEKTREVDLTITNILEGKVSKENNKASQASDSLLYIRKKINVDIAVSTCSINFIPI